MNRRSFINFLISLPFVNLFVPKAKAEAPINHVPGFPIISTVSADCKNHIVPVVFVEGEKFPEQFFTTKHMDGSRIFSVKLPIIGVSKNRQRITIWAYYEEDANQIFEQLVNYFAAKIRIVADNFSSSAKIRRVADNFSSSAMPEKLRILKYMIVLEQ